MNIKKKIIIYFIIAVVASIGILGVKSQFPEYKMLIKKPSDIKDVLLDDLSDTSYYKDKMEIEYITSYAIASHLNKMSGDGFMKNYHKNNTMLVFRIKEPKQLGSIIKSVALKKDNKRIGTNYMGYEYDNGIILFLTVDNYINDIDKYKLDIKIKNAENDTEEIFTRPYVIKNVKDLKTSSYLESGKISKTNKDRNSFVLMLTKKPEVTGMKYSDHMVFKEDIKFFKFGESNYMDFSKMKLLDKNGKELPSKYKTKFALKKEKDVEVATIIPKTIELEVRVDTTSEDDIVYVNEVMKNGKIEFR